MSTRTELVAAIRERYQRSIKADRRSILDEFVAVTGYHRKHAIRLLSSAGEPPVFRVRRVARRYGADAREALIALWEASDRVCSKRLKPLISVLLPALERHGKLVIGAALRGLLVLLVQISPASMDRLLSEVRLVARMQESLQGMSVIQLFAREARERETFAQLSGALRAGQFRSTFYDASLYATVEALGSAAVALLLWYGGGQVVTGALTFGGLVAFLEYTGRDPSDGRHATSGAYS